jgi:hypothetical protein
MDSYDKIVERYLKKVAKADGVVASIIGNTPIPKMCRIKQVFDDFHIKDVKEEIIKQLTRDGTLNKINAGDSVAIGAGSRGITNYAEIVGTVVNEIKRIGGNPFIIPAMGSHGGAIASGQEAVLAGYGITEQTMGCPIRATMETLQVGTSEYGLPVFIDKYALEADGIVIIGRVKPHTSFRGKYESGLLKMLTIGLGKQKGAEICHAQGFKYMAQNLVSSASVILKNCNILFGIAIVENAYDQTIKLSSIPAEKIFDEEPALLEIAKKRMASIMFESFDVLIVDRCGKNISGDGMDPNITGNFTTPYATGGPQKERTVVLDLTEESHGNSVGFGIADYSVQRLFDKMDFEATYPNVLTSTVPVSAKIPIILANDKLAIQAAIKTCYCVNNPKVVRIRDTLSMGEILISESLLEEAARNLNIEILEEPKGMQFDENGNLF